MFNFSFLTQILHKHKLYPSPRALLREITLRWFLTHWPFNKGLSPYGMETFTSSDTLR